MAEARWTPKLEAAVREAQRVVVLTGAGISQESGLATFRGPGGLWKEFRPEELATPEAFEARPEVVWEWYGWRYRKAQEAEPNPGHRAIARWEKLFPSNLVVTQNVDGLHHRAGSRDIVEVHGTLRQARCHRCQRLRDMGEALRESPVAPPICACGGRFRPAVVWFGEALPEAALVRAVEASRQADLFIAVGTSARVYPVAGLIDLACRSGACLVEVNPEPTPFSHLAQLRLAAPAGEALPDLLEELERCRRVAP